MRTTSTSAPVPSVKRNRRAERSRQTVLATALELLYEGGVAGFSVDEVARRSAVAKTTIYRNWPTREALVMDACSQMAAEQETPDTGTVAGDVTAILMKLAHLLATANWSSLVPSIIDTAERHPQFAEIHSQIQRGHATPLRRVIERAVSRGELPAAVDVSTMVSMLLGPLFYRRWFSREPVDGQYVEAVIRAVLVSQRHAAPGS